MSQETGYLTAAGQRLEYRWVGPGPAEAPTLVLLHEGLGCVSLWRDFPERLVAATGCGALVYSRAGYGRSQTIALPRPLDYMQREGEAVVGAVLDAAGVRSAILVGHSDGGSIALVHAATAGRERVAGLVLMAPHVFCEEVSVRSIAAAKREYEAGELRARLQRHHGENVEAAFRGWCEAWLDPAFRRWNLEGYLPQVTAPTLVIQGEDDAYGTIAQVQAIAGGVAGPVETLLLAGCGHSPYRERPEETLAATARFVGQLVR
ncbi:alpha/beta fold hydrolase [Nannocystis bainbridge]|uniref:Alpha/beta hydrolase n=1 Tax=Nannocystis bainbridge TaxID=2995303 RepID=A0ABT5E4A6_9BACT|nr:alpha/beta hydrolase [Nannocystis bainbridge]MDC0720698.1 alpha/beta hydrolase [Nannocystis bainbridge]